jgi:hypothetical protein
MVYNLALNINNFPKCGKCGKDMALAKVVEVETVSKDRPNSLSSLDSIEKGSGEENRDSSIFIWKCTGCGFIVQG